MTLEDLIDQHSHNAAVRVRYGIYRQGAAWVRRCAQELNARGDERWADALESLARTIELQGVRHMGLVVKQTEAGDG